MGLFRSDEVLGIAGETLSFVLNAASETHPREYMGYLRVEDAHTVGLDRDGQVITDVLVIPGTISDSTSATVRSNMKPNAPGSVGSVHSHPSGALRPSDADLGMFRSGRVHIIVGHPYGWNDWRAFDREGNPTTLEVIHVDLPDDEAFFDITQEDIDRELAETERGDTEDDSGGFFSWFR